MHGIKKVALALAASAAVLVGVVPAAAAPALVHPNVACYGHGICLFTGTSYTGTETYLQGNSADLSAIGASTVRSASMGDGHLGYDCWYLYPYKNYSGTPTIVRNNDRFPTMPGGRTSFGSAHYYSSC